MRFRFLKRDLLCIYFMRNLKKDGSKYSIIIYPNHNFFSGSLLGNIIENRCLLKFSLASSLPTHAVTSYDAN